MAELLTAQSGCKLPTQHAGLGNEQPYTAPKVAISSSIPETTMRRHQILSLASRSSLSPPAVPRLLLSRRRRQGLLLNKCTL